MAENTSYNSTFDTSPITELATEWSALSGVLTAQTSALDSAVQGMTWRGDGQMVMMQTWEIVKSVHLDPCAQACQAIADSLNDYASKVQEYQANRTKQAVAMDIAGAVGAILGLATMALMPFAGALFGAIATVVEGAVAALSASLVDTLAQIGASAVLPAVANFVVGAALGAGLTLGEDALAQWIGDTAEGLPFKMDTTNIWVDIGVGGFMGGAAGVGFTVGRGGGPAIEGPSVETPTVVSPPPVEAPRLGADPVGTPGVAPGGPAPLPLGGVPAPVLGDPFPAPVEGAPPGFGGRPVPVGGDPVPAPEGPGPVGGSVVPGPVDVVPGTGVKTSPVEGLGPGQGSKFPVGGGVGEPEVPVGGVGGVGGGPGSGPKAPVGGTDGGVPVGAPGSKAVVTSGGPVGELPGPGGRSGEGGGSGADGKTAPPPNPGSVPVDPSVGGPRVGEAPRTTGTVPAPETPAPATSASAVASRPPETLGGGRPVSESAGGVPASGEVGGPGRSVVGGAGRVAEPGEGPAGAGRVTYEPGGGRVGRGPAAEDSQYAGVNRMLGDLRGPRGDTGAVPTGGTPAPRSGYEAGGGRLGGGSSKADSPYAGINRTLGELRAPKSGGGDVPGGSARSGYEPGGGRLGEGGVPGDSPYAQINKELGSAHQGAQERGFFTDTGPEPESPAASSEPPAAPAWDGKLSPSTRVDLYAQNSDGEWVRVPRPTPSEDGVPPGEHSNPFVYQDAQGRWHMYDLLGEGRGGDGAGVPTQPRYMTIRKDGQWTTVSIGDEPVIDGGGRGPGPGGAPDTGGGAGFTFDRNTGTFTQTETMRPPQPLRAKPATPGDAPVPDKAAAGDVGGEVATPTPSETTTVVKTEAPVSTKTDTATPTETPAPTESPTATPAETPAPAKTSTPTVAPTEAPAPAPTVTPRPAPTSTASPTAPSDTAPPETNPRAPATTPTITVTSPEGVTVTQNHAWDDQNWRDLVSDAQARNPGVAVARPDLSFDDAQRWVADYVHDRATEASFAYAGDRYDVEAHTAYVDFHAQQAHREAWSIVLADLGVAPDHPLFQALPPVGPVSAPPTAPAPSPESQQPDLPSITLTTPDGAVRSQGAVEAEQQWQDWLAFARDQHPGTAATIRTPTWDEAVARTNTWIQAVIDEAAHAHGATPDLPAHAAYIAFHAERAHEQAWDGLLANLGVGPDHPPLPDLPVPDVVRFPDLGQTFAPPPPTTTTPGQAESPVDAYAQAKAYQGSIDFYRRFRVLPPDAFYDYLLSQGRDEAWGRIEQEPESDIGAGLETTPPTLSDPAETGPGPAPSSLSPEALDAVAPRVHFQAPGDTVAHQQAAQAVLRAPGWLTLVAHNKGGLVLDGHDALDGPATARKLGLPTAGSAPADPPTPAAVILAVCNAATTTAAADLHAATGGGVRVLAPTGEAMVAPNGDTWSGTWTADDNLDVVPVPNGHWVLWADGVPTHLYTPSLTEALALLGADAVAGGPPLGQAVAFFHGIEPAQRATLEGFGYTEDPAALKRAENNPESFYESLIAVAGDTIGRVLGEPATPAAIRRRLVETLTADLAELPGPTGLPAAGAATGPGAAAGPGAAPTTATTTTAATTRSLLTPHTDPARILADLADGTVWTRALTVLAPHLAAQAFGLHLGVLGPLGRPEEAGDPHGPRRGDRYGNPLLLVNVGDSFVPARPKAAAPGRLPIELRPRFTPDADGHTAWTRPLTLFEQSIVNQAVQDVEVPRHVEEFGRALGLAQGFAELEPHAGGPDRSALTGLVGDIEHDLDLVVHRWGTATARAALGRLQTLERLHAVLTGAVPETNRRIDELTTAITEAVPAVTPGTGAGLSPQDTAAVTAVATHIALADLAPRLQAARTSVPPPDAGTGASTGIAAVLEEIHAEAVKARTQAETDHIARALQNVTPPRVFEGEGAEARTLADRMRHQRDLRSARQTAQLDAAVSGAVAFDRALSRALADPALKQSVTALAEAGLTAGVADAAVGQVAHAEAVAEAAQADNEQRYVAQVQGEIRAAAEWRIRRANALDALSGPEPDRTLPPGFGEPGPGGTVAYPTGRQGRFVRLGDARLSDAEAVAAQVVAALPDAVRARLGRAAGQAVADFLALHGYRTFVQRALEGGLPLTVGAETVEIHLDLGDLSLAYQVTALRTEQVPIGSKTHNAVEADHEQITGNRASAGGGRGFSVTANAGALFGPTPLASGFTLGVGVGGGSGHEHGVSTDFVSATKRLFELSGQSTYFDIPGAFLSTLVRPRAVPGAATGPAPAPGVPTAPAPAAPPAAAAAAAAPPPPPTHRIPLNVRVAFPTELSPLKVPGTLPGATVKNPPIPTTLPGGAPLPSIDSRALAAEAAGGPLSQAAERLAGVPLAFLTLPESFSGLPGLRATVHGLIGPPPDRQTSEDVETYFSEASFLRMYGELIGAGWTTPLMAEAVPGQAMNLVVRTRLRGAQPVSIDPVPLKEESQRFINVAEGFSESGSVSLSVPTVRISHTLGDPAAAMGGNNGVYGSFEAGGSLSSSRSLSANSGSGHISGLVYSTDSVLYRTVMSVEVRQATAGATPTTMPSAEHEIEAFLRVPLHQRARFEAAVAEAVTGVAPVGGPPPDTDTAPVPDDLPPARREEELWERNNPRHPPRPLTAGTGTGFSAIDHLAGSHTVLPAVMELITEADAPLAWARPWSALDAAYVRRELGSKFTAEGLKNWGQQLFQPGGVKTRLFRPATEGTEVITVTVSGRLTDPARRPKAAGRVAAAKLELMPSAFAGAGGSDEIGAGLSASFGAGGSLGVGTVAPLRTLGAGIGYDFSRTVRRNVGASASGFMLEAILYSGPVRTFDYDVAYDIDVEIEHVKGTTAGGWPTVLGKLLMPAKDTATLTRPRVTAHTWRPGEARFVIVEKLAPRTPPGTAHADTGRATVHRQLPTPGLGPREVAVSDVRPFLQGGHTALTPDDQVMEVLGSGAVAETLAGLLAELNLPPQTYGDLPWTLSTADYLASSQVRGPSVIMSTVVHEQLRNTRTAKILIEGFPHNDRASTEDVPIFRMHVAEGGATVSSGRSKTVKHEISGSFSLGFLAGLLGGGSQTDVLSGSFTKDLGNSTTGDSVSLTPTSGRLTQGLWNYREHTADMLWRITVTTEDSGLLRPGKPGAANAIVDVKDGISFLRLSTPVADVSRGLQFPAPPPGVPPLLRADQPALLPETPHQAGAVRIPTIPAIPNPRPVYRRLPAVPLIPAAAASERLIPGPRPPGRVPDVTGETNPVLEAVKALLSRQGMAHLLGSHWTVEGVGAAGERQVPNKLRNLLNMGSLEALLDLLLGTGLVVTVTTSQAFMNERVQLLLRATRDPYNRGYSYLEYAGDVVNVSRYSFRLNADSAFRSRSDGSSWSVGDQVSENAPAAAQLSALSGTPGFTAGTSRGQGSTRSTTDAIRDTFFISGRAHRYLGDLRIDVQLRKTLIPSRFANTLLLGAPQRRPRTTQLGVIGAVHLHERVLIPESLLTGVSPVRVPVGPSVAAVEEIRTGGPAAHLGAPTGITPADLRAHDVVAFGFDHEKLEILFSEATERFRGKVRPLSGAADDDVARLADRGTRSRDVLRYMLSQPMLSRNLDIALSPGGLDSPRLYREGGPLTDVAGRLNIRIELTNPQVLGSIDAWNESVGYGFTGRVQDLNQGFSRGLRLGGGWKSFSADVTANPPSTGANLSVTASRGRSSFAMLKSMPRAEAANRRVPWTRVVSDAVVHLTMRANRSRDLIEGREKEVSVSFRIRGAAEFGLSPEAALRTGLIPRAGLPVPSGVFVPGPNETVQRMRAAFAAPPTEDVLQIWATVDDRGRFLVGDRVVAAPDFHRHVLRGRDLRNKTLVLMSGGALAAAQALADLTGRPVIAPDSGLTVTPDGSALAGRGDVGTDGIPGPGRWTPGHWTEISPAAWGRPPVLHPEIDLGYVLARSLPASRAAAAYTWAGPSPKLSHQHEARIGRLLLTDDTNVAAARAMLARMRDVLRALNPGVERPRIDEAFFTDVWPSSAGQVGVHVSVDSLLREGNGRELLTAYFNGTYMSQHRYTLSSSILRAVEQGRWKDLHKAGVDVGTLDAYLEFLDPVDYPSAFDRRKFEYGAPLDLFSVSHLAGFFGDGGPAADELTQGDVRQRRDREERDPYRFTVKEMSAVGLGLGKFEGSYLRTLHALDRSDRSDRDFQDAQLPWTSGQQRFQVNPDSQWYRSVTVERGIPLLSGPSGTAARLLAFTRIMAPKADLGPFAGALTGWMVAMHDHSLYEVVQGLRGIGYTVPGSPALIRGPEDLYAAIPGLPRGALNPSGHITVPIGADLRALLDHAVVPTRSGIAVLDHGDEALMGAWLPRFAGSVTVAVHLDPQTGRPLVDGRILTYKQALDFLRPHLDAISAPGTRVVLVACGGAPLAQYLSRELGREIVAANGTVVQGVDRRVTTADVSGGLPRPEPRAWWHEKSAGAPVWSVFHRGARKPGTPTGADLAAVLAELGVPELPEITPVSLVGDDPADRLDGGLAGGTGRLVPGNHYFRALGAWRPFTFESAENLLAAAGADLTPAKRAAIGLYLHGSTFSDRYEFPRDVETFAERIAAVEQQLTALGGDDPADRFAKPGTLPRGQYYLDHTGTVRELPDDLFSEPDVLAPGDIDKLARIAARHGREADELDSQGEFPPHTDEEYLNLTLDQGRTTAIPQPAVGFGTSPFGPNPKLLRPMRDTDGKAQPYVLYRSAHRDDEILYRKDPWPPAVVFGQGLSYTHPGLPPSVRMHQLAAIPNAFVSTTRTSEIDLDWGTFADGSELIYTIKAPGGFDLVTTLGASAHVDQQEVAFYKGIRPQFVQGVIQRGADGSQVYTSRTDWLAAHFDPLPAGTDVAAAVAAGVQVLQGTGLVLYHQIEDVALALVHPHLPGTVTISAHADPARLGHYMIRGLSFSAEQLAPHLAAQLPAGVRTVAVIGSGTAALAKAISAQLAVGGLRTVNVLGTKGHAFTLPGGGTSRGGDVRVSVGADRPGPRVAPAPRPRWRAPAGRPRAAWALYNDGRRVDLPMGSDLVETVTGLLGAVPPGHWWSSASRKIVHQPYLWGELPTRGMLGLGALRVPTPRPAPSAVIPPRSRAATAPHTAATGTGHTPVPDHEDVNRLLGDKVKVTPGGLALLDGGDEADRAARLPAYANTTTVAVHVDPELGQALVGGRILTFEQTAQLLAARLDALSPPGGRVLLVACGGARLAAYLSGRLGRDVVAANDLVVQGADRKVTTGGVVGGVLRRVPTAWWHREDRSGHTPVWQVFRNGAAIDIGTASADLDATMRAVGDVGQRTGARGMGGDYVWSGPATGSRFGSGSGSGSRFGPGLRSGPRSGPRSGYGLRSGPGPGPGSGSVGGAVGAVPALDTEPWLPVVAGAHTVPLRLDPSTGLPVVGGRTLTFEQTAALLGPVFARLAHSTRIVLFASGGSLLAAYLSTLFPRCFAAADVALVRCADRRVVPGFSAGGVPRPDRRAWWSGEWTWTWYRDGHELITPEEDTR